MKSRWYRVRVTFIKTKRQLHYPAGTIKAESILKVRKINVHTGGYVVLDGPYAGCHIYQEDTDIVPEVVWMHQELLQLREERAELMRQNARLQKALDEEIETKKVELPWYVADAIEDFRVEGKDVDYIIQQLTVSLPFGTSQRLRVLREFAIDNGLMLVRALVNGYKVDAKSTPEDRLNDILIRSVGEDRADDLLKKIKPLIKAVGEQYAESR